MLMHNRGERSTSGDDPVKEEISTQKAVVRGISWSLDGELSNDGLSSNERIVKIMSRNNSELLSKWVDAVKMKTGKAEIARTILKEFHKCGATHRQKPEDMVKGLSAFFKRYETYKEKLEEQTTEPCVKYNEDGDLEFVGVSSFLQAYLNKNFPDYLELTKAFDVLYRHRPELLEGDAKLADGHEGPSTLQRQVNREVQSSDEESSADEVKVEIDVDKDKAKVKRRSKDVKWEKDTSKLKKLKAEAEIRRFEAETKRMEFETQERVLALHARYNEPRFVGTEESKAAQFIFKSTFPSLFPDSTSNHHDSEVDELEE